MGYELKTFKVDETVNNRFIEECNRQKVGQGNILQNLMIRWVKMKAGTDKKLGNIYPEID